MSDKKDSTINKEPVRKPTSGQVNESDKRGYAYDGDGGGISSGSIATNARPTEKDKK